MLVCWEYRKCHQPSQQNGPFISTQQIHAGSDEIQLVDGVSHEGLAKWEHEATGRREVPYRR